ncbi:NAD(P)-binding domain-containing protein [Sorangium sp. So ce1389]
MKIGVIGAGHVGGTLTRGLAKLGHEVFVANSRGPHTLAELASETGASVEEAARAGEVVVVTASPCRSRATMRTQRRS